MLPLRKCVLILNLGIIFVFASVKMDVITPKKRAKIVAFNEHTSIGFEGFFVLPLILHIGRIF
jgi:hypothetical protein